MNERPPQEKNEQFTPEDREIFKKWVSTYLGFRELNRRYEDGRLPKESKTDQLLRESTYYAFHKPLTKIGLHFDMNHDLFFDIGPEFPEFLKTFGERDMTPKLEGFLLTEGNTNIVLDLESEMYAQKINDPKDQKQAARQFIRFAGAYDSLSKKTSNKIISNLFHKQSKKFVDDAEAMRSGWYGMHHELCLEGLRYPVKDIKTHQLFLKMHMQMDKTIDWKYFFSDWQEAIGVLRRAWHYNPDARKTIVEPAVLLTQEIIDECKMWIVKYQHSSLRAKEAFEKLSEINELLHKLVTFRDMGFEQTEGGEETQM